MDALNMIQPEVFYDFYSVLLISPEEGETDCNDDKTLSELQVFHGAQLDVEDLIFVDTEYELQMTIIQAEIKGFEINLPLTFPSERDSTAGSAQVIQLPDKFVVISGEEDETILFLSRAKLYRFCDKSWHDYGVGEVKILKHKQTGQLR